jgi:hypothetical protein
MSENYNLAILSEEHNKKFDTFTIEYRVNILDVLTIHDYYKIINDIINENKDDNFEIRITIAIFDENNLRMNFETQLMNINDITPNHLFDVVEKNSEDDDKFFISETTIFTIQKVRLPS